MIGLEYIRNLHCMSQQDLANTLGVTRSYINGIERKRLCLSDKIKEELKGLFRLPETIFEKDLSDRDKIWLHMRMIDEIKKNTNNNKFNKIELTI